MLKHKTLTGLLLLAATGIASANAVDYASYLLDKATIRTNTYLGAWSYSFEDEEIEAAYQKYLATQASANVPIIGQPVIYAIGGTPQSPGFPDVLTGPGNLLSVDFGFIDPTTSFAASGPPIGFVEYLVSTDPNNPASYTPFGISTDASSNFSFSYLDNTVFEPDIEAIPFDVNGNPIVIPGVDGFNAAIGSVTALAAPEPSTTWLILAGAILILSSRMRFRLPFRTSGAQKGDWLGLARMSPLLRNFVPVPFLPRPESYCSKIKRRAPLGENKTPEAKKTVVPRSPTAICPNAGQSPRAATDHHPHPVLVCEVREMSSSIGDGLTALALAGGIVGYLYVTHRTRQKRLEIIHEERMAAMEKGIPLPEFPLEPAQAPRDLDPHVLPILGIFLLTLSVGTMIVLFLTIPAPSHSIWVAPLPFTFLGVGLIAFSFLNRKAG